MKIVHTSDLHLGARLHEEDRGAEHDVFLGWLADLLRAERPDALVVCGDVFDVKAPPVHAQERYYRFLARLVADGSCRQVVITAGNHDSAKFLAAPESLLNALRIKVSTQIAIGDRVEDSLVAIEGRDGEPGLVIAAVPFAGEAELANAGLERIGPEATREERIRAGWSALYGETIAAARAKLPGAAVVVTGHATLASAKTSDAESERCRRIGGLEAYDADALEAAEYAAMGHLHLPQACGASGKVHYSGSPLKMSFDEADGEKCVCVVELDGAGSQPVVKKVPVPVPVELETVSGTPDEIKARLSWLAASGGAKRYLRLQFRDFEGTVREHRQACRELVQGTDLLILAEEDLRPPPAAAKGLKAFANMDAATLNPELVARRKLETSSKNYSEEQIEAYMDLFRQVAATVAARHG